MHPNTRKERFSLAYIAAIAARAGFEFLESSDDFDSIDGLLRSAQGRRPKIEFQAKATSRDLVRADHIAFPLGLKNYDELRIETITPRLLFVVILPNDEEQWLSQSQDELILRHCGYWQSLRGMPDVVNEHSVTVRLPRTQIVSVEQISALMAKAELGPVL